MRAMKDSGIKWIGEIPKEWEVCRLKDKCTLKGRIGWKGLRSDEFKEESYAYLITGQDFKKSEIDWKSCYQIDKDRYDEDEFIQVSNGDLLITKDGTIGKIAKVSNLLKPATLNSGIFVLKQKNNEYSPNYLYWLLVSPLLVTFNNYMNLGGTTIIHLYQNVFERMPMPSLPLSEQQRIAAFLDTKCGEIDKLIGIQEKFIEELKAYKQSVISEAVTKGINPNAKMKDSVVEWIGVIPEEWDVRKTLYVLAMPITDGPHTTPTLYKDGVPFVSAEAVSTGNGSIDFEHIRGFISEEFYQECCKKYIPQKNDIYMIKSGATTGRVSIVDTDIKFTIWSPLAVFRCNLSIMYPKYLYYEIQSNGYQKQIELGWSFGTQQNIGMRTLEKLIVCVPPLSEQRAIATYLDNKCSQIDSLIALKQTKIEELKSFKKSLIYEYVTGKKTMSETI